jgi:RimJ/RimL family protein N-acetyltransferase
MSIIDFQKEYILQNDRALLRPLQKDDFHTLQHFSAEQPEIWKYSQQPADSPENLKRYIAYALNGKKNGNAYPFIIFDKLSNQYAGTSRLYDYQPIHSTVQLGYTWYGKEFQGSGLNKQCKLLLLEFAFEEWNLDRVEFRADTRNVRSIAAMKSIGCKVEGVLRNNCAAPSGRRDSIVLSILREEWFGNVKDQLKTKIESEKRILKL